MAILDKIVYAGVNNSSFEQGSQDLLKLAEIEVSAKQVERVTERIGAERVAERNEAVKAYQELSLTERKAVPRMVKLVSRTRKRQADGTWRLLPTGVLIQIAHQKWPSTECRIFGAELSAARIKARTPVMKLRKCRLLEQLRFGGEI